MKNNKVLLAQVVGLFVIILGRFGIELSATDQADLISGLSVVGLIITSAIAWFVQKQDDAKNEPYRRD